jgi:AraC family transcriptional activator of tynA and feaB
LPDQKVNHSAIFVPTPLLRLNPMTLWTTDSVAPAEREAYWVEAVNAAFLRMHTRARQRHGFYGRLRRHVHGPLALVEVQSMAQDVHRFENHLDATEPAAFYLISQKHHAWTVEQEGLRAELCAGDLVLIDAAMPYHFHCPEGVDNWSLELPRAWLGQWLPQPEVATRIAGHGGLGLALRGLMQGLCEAPHTSSGAWLDAIGSTLQLQSLIAEPRNVSAPDRRWLRALDALQARLGEHGLQAADIAADTGCSVATLHRLFSAQGQGFADRLQALRIQRAAQMLRAPVFARLTLAEVGYRCGFSDPSHFSRAFRSLQACSPSQWRHPAEPKRGAEVPQRSTTSAGSNLR